MDDTEQRTKVSDETPRIASAAPLGLVVDYSRPSGAADAILGVSSMSQLYCPPKQHCMAHFIKRNVVSSEYERLFQK